MRLNRGYSIVLLYLPLQRQACVQCFSTAASANNNMATRSFHVYPFHPENAAEIPSNAKIVHFVRHAQGAHNVNMEYRAMMNMDARLTDIGRQQCQALASRIDNATPESDSSLHALATGCELIVTSPLTRCIQTSLLSFEPILPNVRVLAHDGIRETVNYNCDRRRLRSVIQKESVCPTTKLPLVDFTHVATEHDDVWDAYERRLGCHETYTGHRESAELYVVADRARRFLQWIMVDRPETHIAVCSHAAFLRCFWNFGHGDVPKLVPQVLDERKRKDDVPVIRYDSANKDFTQRMRDDFENCELRSVIIASY